MNAACRPIAVQRFKPLDGTKPVYSRRDNTWRPDNDIWIRQQDWQLTVSNHRPVSNVYVQDRKACRCQATSISIWRKWFAKNRYLDRQSAYRCHRSTEKAILRVVSDVLTAGDLTLLTLLDLSALFDCVAVAASTASELTDSQTQFWHDSHLQRETKSNP